MSAIIEICARLKFTGFGCHPAYKMVAGGSGIREIREKLPGIPPSFGVDIGGFLVSCFNRRHCDTFSPAIGTATMK